MGFEIHYIFRKELGIKLKPTYVLFKKYIHDHPIPGVQDAIIELFEIDSPDFTAWTWGWLRSIEQIAWQALCDKWLRDHYSNFSAMGVKGIGIKIMLNNKTDEIKTSDSPTLIAGEGLASFQALAPKFQMEKLVVSDELREKITNTISVIQNINLIYNEWGFSEIDSQPKAVLNFFGPPGTGKTMAAHCIADALSKKIIIANFAEIESKYVGDSPKNLENIFTVAKNEDAVLFLMKPILFWEKG